MMDVLRLFWTAADEERRIIRRNRNSVRQRTVNLEEIPDLLFRELYRLDKPTFYNLCHELRTCSTLRGTRNASVEAKVLCALSFFATGSYQRIVGLSQQIPQRTTSTYIGEVVDALNNRSIVDKWIHFPQTFEERSQLKRNFQRKFHLPGVIGCIDCTHIAIVKPAQEEHLYFNRKGYHSINVQMVCDSTTRIRSINAKFGGATHDSYIWSSSQVETYMRGLHQNGEQVWLLGDSGYPLRPWLMTPVLDAASGSREEIYTTRHLQARNCIERCFGILKSRWRCLLKDRTLHYQPYVASKITIACCVLHNMALTARLPPPTDLQVLNEHDYDGLGTPINTSPSSTELIQGRAIRNCLINRI